MAHVARWFFLRHLRAEPTSHVLRFESGRLTAEGRGLAFWFLPLSTSVAEVPVDDRELPFLVRVPSTDFQDVSVQGSLQWRVADARRLAERVDFSLDLDTGRFREDPLETIAGMLGPLVRQLAEQGAAGRGLRELVERGSEPVRAAIEAGLRGDGGVAGLGLEVVAVRVASVRPEAQLERALQTPTREAIQQRADEATFARRAVAVEKERAIQENELQSRIELAAREEHLVAQHGRNERLRAEQDAEARRVEADAQAARTRVTAEAEAARITAVEGATVTAEEARIAIYRDLPPQVLLGLAARALADNLTHIEHLAVSPDLLGPLLTQLLTAGTARLEQR